MMRLIPVLICYLILIPFLSAAQIKTIPFNDIHIRYQGRIVNRADAAELSWPGNSALICFKGREISVTLKDQDTANYYNVIVDGKVVNKIHTDTAKRVYVLARGLSKGKHRVELFKRTEWDKGKTWLYGFELPAGSKLLNPPALPKRKIEFYGNSITCGYAIEDSSGDSPTGYYENNYLTYAAVTARHFNAQYYCIAKSGIGILVSWFPLIMREMYDRADPTDPESKWDFSRYTPDIVVVNLFQNDSWIVKLPDNEQFKARFGTNAPDSVTIVHAYESFLRSIRNKYPSTNIICSLGSMDATRDGSEWPGYIKSAVKELNDQKIFIHLFPYKNTSGHPEVAEQKAMADSLIRFIEEQFNW